MLVVVRFLVLDHRLLKKEADNIIELIRIDDLVGLSIIGSQKLNYKNVIAIGKEFVYFLDSTSAHINDVMQILKPNKNRGYDLAWEREE